MYASNICKNVSGPGDLTESQKVVCRVLEIDDESGWIRHRKIFSGGGNFVDPHETSRVKAEDVSPGDHLVFKYTGGTAVTLLGVDTD